ncbi:hypothetical protein K439DRAFT_573003 [Ramaria rubella]|nr:hypothetical protein K439DRAFT_573003 [Ramaria rubella]
MRLIGSKCMEGLFSQALKLRAQRCSTCPHIMQIRSQLPTLPLVIRKTEMWHFKRVEKPGLCH